MDGPFEDMIRELDELQRKSDELLARGEELLADAKETIDRAGMTSMLRRLEARDAKD